MKTLVLPYYFVSFFLKMVDEDLTQEELTALEDFLSGLELKECIKISEDTFLSIDDLYKVEQTCLYFTFDT